MPITFAYPQLALAVLLVVPILWLAHRRRKALGHSNVGSMSALKGVPILGRIPSLMLIAMWVLLCLALARPQLPDVGEKEVIQSRDFIIATDISGSMSSAISDPAQQQFAGTTGQQPQGDAGQPAQVTRIQVAEKAIDVFVQQRQGDRVALFLFDDEVYYSWPLSRDLKVIRYKNKGVSRYNGGGTNFDGDGVHDKMGPLQAAINHFKELGQAKSKVVIMVTDGEASISEKRSQELIAAYAKYNIKLYVLGVGDSWTSGSSSTADIRKLAEATGGTVITVGNADEMRQGFATINNMEKSSVVIQKTVSYRDIYYYFLIAALAAGLIYLLSSVVVREDA